MKTGDNPDAILYDRASGRVFTFHGRSADATAFDAARGTAAGTVPLGGKPEFAVADGQGRVYVNIGLMAVVDAGSGRVIATLPIGTGVDGAAFDADRGLAFSSNGEGTLTVVHEDSPDSFRVVESVPTRAGARTIALDPKTHRLFLSTAELGPRPSPTAEVPRPRPSVVPGSFVILVLDRRPLR